MINTLTKAFLFSLIGFASSLQAQAPTAQGNAQLSASLPAYSKIYSEQSDPFKDAAAAIRSATSSNRNVLIEIGGNWCTWCHKIDAFLEQNPDIYQALHANFVLLKVSVSDANENEAFMKGLPPVLGYPHMYVSTAQGKVLLSKDTAEFLRSGSYSREQWLNFIDEWQFANNDSNLAKQKKIKNKNNTSD
ncbi:thioredoxin family protein [Thalassomonas sp. M1454]|uniref:thioredoxin family protein n=1 Tax=Thalassomonas sp. M1454 TaxID=2594477 RepID=UPI0011803C6C|nr:thioredoxin family protein [Thalassomonas sp. M1454]TRX55121.1 thioredoxin family protein [Thalassomonas sp. M1454]